MSKDFILPDIGEGIVECEIVEWLVAEGDEVKEDQPVVEVMTDKAMVEIPAKDDGVVEKLYYQKGDIAKVHEPLFRINAVGEASESDTENATESASEEKPAEKETSTSEEKSASGGDTTDFILPDIGEGIVECEIVEWLVAEGDEVKEDQPVVEVMTDKATVEIPAKDDGKVVKLYHKKGDIAEVHKPLFALQPAGGVQSSGSKAPQSHVERPSQVKSSTDNIETQAEAPANARQGKAIASPAVRRLARENDINIADVSGSGKKGRVLKDDIEAFKSGGQKPQAATESQQPQSATASTGGTRTEAIRGVKAAMAKQMMKSVSTIPHFTYADEFDLTNLIALREKLKEQYKEKGIRLTVMPFFIKALSLALKEFPVMNAQVNEDCTEMTYFDDHNIGMAVDTKIGLLVPNVKQVQNKSIIDVANEVTRLTQASREGKVPQADMKGGTISISNIGVIGGTVATPIINKPEAAIVALGKVQELPRFDEDGNVVARKIMTVSWSGDHRIIDGGTIARFNKRWQEYLEDPSSMLVNMV